MSWVLPVLVGVLGLVPLGVVVAARWLDAVAWQRSLVSFRLQLPSGLSSAEVAQFLAAISATTHAPSWSLLPMPPVCVEVAGTAEGIAFYLSVSRSNRDTVLSGLRATLPGIRINTAHEHLASEARFNAGAELGLTNRSRPLASERAESTSTAILAALLPLGEHEEIRFQWIFTSAGTPPPTHGAAPGEDRWWSAYLLNNEQPKDAEAVRALRTKRQQPLLRSVGRVSVRAATRGRALRLLGRVWPALHTANAPGVRIVRRWVPARLVASQVTARTLPLIRWPLLLNANEATGLLAFPLGGTVLPGLNSHRARQLPSPPQMPHHGAVVARSNYTGTFGEPLALKDEDRLRHIWINGPTGYGKSTLLGRLALHDIRAGHGVIVVDPKNDLVEDILARLPDHRIADTIVLDPSDLARPIGLNILRSAAGEHGRELAADNVVHIFSQVWKSSFGPRTSDVLRNALLTLTHTTAPDGSAFTLCEVPELLGNAAFRRSVTSQPTVPLPVQGFWSWYESLSDRERASVTAPSLNKLRALTTRSALRLTLGQSEGIDFSTVFRERKVVLVSLSKGVVGSDTAQLLGALVVASLWQACLERIAVAPDQRQPVFAHLDEFADIVRLPVPLADVLSQARGLGLSLTLASQYAGQLPEAIRAAVFGTARTHIAMQLDYDDARLLEKRFSPLTAEDLMHLQRYEVAVRPCVNGQTLKPVTGTTLPLPDRLHNGRRMAQKSRRRYGSRRTEIEAGLRRRIATSVAAPAGHRFGRRHGGRA